MSPIKKGGGRQKPITVICQPLRGLLSMPNIQYFTLFRKNVQFPYTESDSESNTTQDYRENEIDSGLGGQLTW